MTDSYVVIVKATDGGKPSLHGSTTVMVNVTDTNDNPPVFKNTSMTAVISEASAVSSYVTKITASDLDTGSNAEISYRIISGNEMSAFAIFSDTGIITTNMELDRENISNYALICRATDHGNKPLHSMSIIVHVTLSDVNDNAPKFDQSVYIVNVTEDVSSGTVVEEIHAVDKDAGLNGLVSYQITDGNDDGTFDIGNGTGVVTVSGKLDRETQDFYTLIITASDSGHPQKSSSVQLLITVTDVNDNAPLFNASSLQGAILENSPIGTSVMRVIATDADVGENAQLMFNFSTNVYVDIFAIDSASGEITALKSLDREKQDLYKLKISVSDHGDPRLSSSADVTITVTDVDDNCPKFVPAVYNATISENLPFNQIIVQVTATDADVKDNERMLYAIWQGNEGGAFTIDRYGFVRVSSAGVDREVTSSFQLVVRAGRADCGINSTGDGNTAEGGPDDRLAAMAIVNLIVIDQNDNAPRFTRPNYEFPLSSPNDTNIGRIQAIDDDLDLGGVVKFRLLQQIEVERNWKVTVQAYDMGTPSLNNSIDVFVTSRIACQAMVFKVTEDGVIQADTLCNFVKIPTAATRLVGDKHQMSCLAKGNTRPQYRWMKDGRFVSNWDDLGDYVIEHVTEEDEGSYSCLATSSAGLIQSSVAYMTVNEPPKIVVHPQNSSVELGGTVTLACNATGDPLPEFQWYKDSIPMVETSDIDPFKPELVLKDALAQDEARYFCQASNVAGKVRSGWATLKVFGKNALVSMTLSVTNPNQEGTCQMFDKNAFQQLLSKALQANVDVVGFSAPDRCEEHPCNSNPCKNGAVCSKQGLQYACLCRPGWSGDHCELDVDECSGDPCFYNGTCANTAGSYKCNCASAKTGKNCQLEKKACDGNPCKGSKICALSERAPNGYQCVDEGLETVMVLSGGQQGSLFDIEKQVENIIRSAPNNVNESVNARRVRRADVKLDYGACSVRVTKYQEGKVHFVLLCPPEMKPPEPQSAQRFVCGLLFDAGRSTSCGGSDSMETPVPPTTTPPMEPMEVKLELFARDESGNDLNSAEVIDMINSGRMEELEQNGFKVKSATASYTEPSKADPPSKVGLIVGLTIGFLVLTIAVIAVGLIITKRRKKPQNFHFSIQQRAAMARKDSQECILSRDRSVKNISRSEKHYLNVAYDDICDNSDEEGQQQFMVEVDLGNLKSRKIAMVCDEPYFYEKISTLEAEEMLSSMVQPGTFLVREGASSKEFALTVRAPEGGPSFRHLPFKYDKASGALLVTEFGTMDDEMNFSSMQELVSHFQVTPITFDEDSPDVVLTHPWNKSVV